MPDNMTKKWKKKVKIVDYDSDTEGSPTPRVELIYEDTKSATGAEPEFKWGQIYHMLVGKKVPEARLEDLALYDNILRSRITKASTTRDVSLRRGHRMDSAQSGFSREDNEQHGGQRICILHTWIYRKSI